METSNPGRYFEDTYQASSDMLDDRRTMNYLARHIEGYSASHYHLGLQHCLVKRSNNCAPIRILLFTGTLVHLLATPWPQHTPQPFRTLFNPSRIGHQSNEEGGGPHSLEELLVVTP